METPRPKKEEKKQKRIGEAFGDMMAQEGETSNIPTIILLMYFLIGLYSYACHVVAGDPL